MDELFNLSLDCSHLLSSLNANPECFDLSDGTIFNEDSPSYQTAAALAFAETIAPMIIYTGWTLLTTVTWGFGFILLPGAMILSGLASSPYHRHYLGTNDHRFKIEALYCLTSNGFGVITVVDGIMLLLAEEGDSHYIENDSFIMWMDD